LIQIYGVSDKNMIVIDRMKTEKYTIYEQLLIYSYIAYNI